MSSEDPGRGNTPPKPTEGQPRGISQESARARSFPRPPTVVPPVPPSSPTAPPQIVAPFNPAEQGAPRVYKRRPMTGLPPPNWRGRMLTDKGWVTWPPTEQTGTPKIEPPQKEDTTPQEGPSAEDSSSYRYRDEERLARTRTKSTDLSGPSTSTEATTKEPRFKSPLKDPTAEAKDQPRKSSSSKNEEEEVSDMLLKYREDLAEKKRMSLELEANFKQIFGGKEPERPTRPKEAFVGREIALLANMVSVKLNTDMTLYRYELDLAYQMRYTDQDVLKNPKMKRDRAPRSVFRRLLVEAIFNIFHEELRNCLPAYDGLATVYTTKKLPDEYHAFGDIKLRSDRSDSTFCASLLYTGTVNLNTIAKCYGAGDCGFTMRNRQAQEAIQALDVVLRTGLALAYQPVGRSYFTAPDIDKRAAQYLGKGRELWFGFYTSLRLGEWKPMLNVDFSATIFYQGGPVLEFMAKCCGLRSHTEFMNIWTPFYSTACMDQLYKLSVKPIHRERGRAERVKSFTMKSAAQETFEKDGQRITVQRYLEEKYNIKLEYPNLPCLRLGARGTMLPPELCYLERGQQVSSLRYDRDITSNMIRKLAIPPADRFKKIRDNIKEMTINALGFTKEFDMEIDTKWISVSGKQLIPPQISFGKAKKIMPDRGVWKSDTFLAPVNLENWSVAILGRVTDQAAQAAIGTLREEGKRLGMMINRPAYIHNFGPQAKMKDMLDTVKRKVPEGQLTLVMLAENSKYAVLKASAETTHRKMMTQCVRDVNVNTKFNNMFANNLLQKMNMKLGGKNSGLVGPAPQTMKKPFMVVGIDINHARAGDRRTPSIAAMVSSTDKLPTRYYSCIRAQVSRTVNRIEYVIDAREMMLECLHEFNRHNKRYPEHLFIFRDGVAEDQIEMIRQFELGSFRQACLDISETYTPTMTFILVQKRHHVRFMPVDWSKGVGNARNIPPGTVVDTEVVSARTFDFYLCSHFGIQGTSRPAHYHVVHDDGVHLPEEIYNVSYYLCHTYGRCTRSVSIPAPVYYAHLAASRAKEHITGAVYDEEKKQPPPGSSSEDMSTSSGSSTTSSPHSSSESSKEDNSHLRLRHFKKALRVRRDMRNSMYFI